MASAAAGRRTSASPPPWLLELLDQASSAPSREQQPDHHVGEPGNRVQKGKRHDSLVGFARRIRAGCKSYDEFEAALVGWGGARCEPPIERAEVVRQAEDLYPRLKVDGNSIILTPAADIKPVPIHWLWPGRIARGKLSLLVGHPGVGKSQLALVLAATASQGWNWPDGAPGCLGDTLILSAEDDPADTIIPRLMANGANLDRVYIIRGVRAGFTPEGREVPREIRLVDDIDKLSAALEKIPDAALVVVDPISAYLGELDSHRDASVRGLLAPLAALAAERRVAVLAIAHLNKNAHADALSRVTGSLAFVAAARSAWLVGKDPHNAARRLFVPLKNNLGADGNGLAFEIQPTTVRTEAGELPTTSLLWVPGEVTTTASEILAAGGSAHERGDALTEAEAFLSELLAEGPVSSEEVKRQSNAAGLSWATVRRAKEALKISVRKCGFAGGWEWSLPPKVLKFPEDAQAAGGEPLRRS